MQLFRTIPFNNLRGVRDEVEVLTCVHGNVDEDSEINCELSSGYCIQYTPNPFIFPCYRISPGRENQFVLSSKRPREPDLWAKTICAQEVNNVKYTSWRNAVFLHL